MSLKSIFEKRIFWLFFLSLLIGWFFASENEHGINKTVGWAYSMSNLWIIAGFFTFGSLLLFVLGYGFLALLGKKTRFKLSLLHFFLFIATLTISSIDSLFTITSFLTNLFSLLVFGINFSSAMKSGKQL